MAKKIIYTAVQFSYPGQKPVRVPVADAFDWYDTDERLWSASKVFWHYDDEPATEEVWSCAKSWTFWDGKDRNDVNGRHRLTRVGSGAYGDGIVINRTVAGMRGHN